MALLFVLAAVAFAAPSRAAVLVSNLGQASGGGATVDSFDKAQAFTTGANTGGYTLTSVELNFGTVTGTSVFTVSIWSSNSSGRPNSLEGTLTNPASLTGNSDNTFTASGSGIDLSRSTTYLVVVDGTSGTARVNNVNSAASANAEDATSATGWSIADDSLFRTASSTGSWSTFNESMYIQVNGAAKTGTDTTAPAFASAAANGAALVITFDEDLAAAASLANSAFTVKKTASGGSEATVALSTSVAPVISGTTVTLTLGTALVSTDGSVKVTYTKPATGSANKLADAAGNETATFTDQTVTNNTPAASCTAPSFGTRRNIWTGSLTVGSSTGLVGFSGSTGALNDKTFSIGSSDHEIDALFLDVRVAPSLALVFSLKDTVLTSAEKAALRLHVCNTTTVDLSAATYFSSNRNYNVAYSGAAWTSGSTLAVYLSLPANNAATGAPTISGTAAVGHTLMAATGTIADADGVPTTLTYQWLRVDGANEADITGATESSYTVTAADIGKTLKIKLGFTDNLSGEESRTSAATATVAQPPTVSIAAVYPKASPGIAHPEFRVTISAAQTSAVTVNLSIDQDASYLSSTTQTIEIQANQTSATKKFTSNIFSAGTTSGDLTATVVAGTGYVPAPTPANAATVEVVAKGVAGVLSYRFAEAAYSVDEGDSLDVVVTLSTAADVPKPRESFNVSSILTTELTGEADMAVLNVDYTHTSGTQGGFYAPSDWSADGAVFTATRTYTVPTTEDSAYEGNERFKIVLSRAAGGLGSIVSPSETIVTIVDDEALKVTGVAVTSTPSSGSTYGAGETLSFTATFNGPVTVTGTPQLPFSLGGVTRQAAYASGSDSAALVFSYTVAAGDNDTDGVSWRADALSLNGGAIKFMTSIVANRVDAALTHAAKTARSGHKVDTPPVLSTPTVNGAALVLTYNEALDTSSEPAGSAFTVKVGGTAVSLATSGAVAVSGSTVTLTLAAAVAAAATVTVSYAVPTSNPLQDAGGTDAPAFTDLAVTNGTGNTAPAFANDTAARSFTETVGDAAVATAGNVGAVVTATDVDADTLTYSLEGADAAKFGIVSGSGQLQTKAGQKYDRETKASYSVTVKADDSNSGTDTVAVTISVNNAVEIPLAPGMPAVSATSGSTTSLDVSWTAPVNTGRPALSGYKLRYRTGSGAWTDHSHTGVGTSTTIASLTAATAYEVQVLAVNADGDGAWSASGSGTTGSSSNNAPVFANTTTSRSFTETVGDATEAAARDVGAVVTATDADADTLTYSLEGTDAAKFTVNSSSGQLRTRAGERYDREAKASYAVRVKADDGNSGTDTVAVTISVVNVVEKPLTPAVPTVAATSGSTTSLDVSWTAPVNTGRPALSGYKLRYRTGSGGWTDHAHSGAGTSATIASLTPSTAYEVQVRALNADGDGAWSASGTGTTGSLSNNAPAFSSNTTSRSFTETVGDAVAAASNVGAVVTATDADGDTLTYSLEGTDAAKFTVNSSSGQLRTKAGERYDREAKASYAVRVKADDGMGGADTVAVTITLANAVEIPLAPGMPAVAATSGNTTSLDVRWRAPGNAGRPAITGYKLQYRQGGSGAWTAHAHSGTGTTATIGSLATDTTYQVQVRALNADGDGPWSAAGSRSTGAVAATVPGAPRGFTAAPDNARVTLSWSAPASDGGAPITTYRYRHATRTMSLSGAAWTEVPDSDADGDGADEREVTVTGLTNGTEYPFEVQALNSAGGGAAARTSATPTPPAPVALIRPSAPRELRAAGSLYSGMALGLVKLSWEAPSNLGNAALIRYEYRYAARAAALSSARWNHGPISERTTVRNLAAGTSYTFQLRAVTGAGAGAFAAVGVSTPRSTRLNLSVFTRGAAVEGENLTIGVRRSGLPGSDKGLLAVVDIHDSAGARWSAKAVDIAVGAREGTVAFRVPFDGARGAARELAVTLSPDSWDPLGTTYIVGTPATTTVPVRNRDPLLRVADATVREGPQAQLQFNVSLDRAAAVTVTVDYATADDTATAGADYTATSDTLSFAAGETAKTVLVPVLDDAHDEGIETLTLTLSNARGAAIDDATATGRIVNTDPMPAAWLARFGRTGATQVLGLLDARFDEARAPASQLTLGGRPVNLSGLRGAPQGRADPTAGPAPADADPFDVLAAQYTLDDTSRGPAARHADPSAVPDPAAGAVGGGGEATLLERLAWRLLTRGGWSVDRRQFLSGSSFDLSLSALGRETDAAAIETARVRETPGHWSMWGRGALVRFTGQDRGLSLDGDVLTGLLGLDYSRGRWLAGVGLAYNDGDGAYRASDSGATGELDSTLVSVHPYLHYALTDRLSAWGTLGYGAGGLRRRPGRDGAPELETLETDIQMRMGALGLRGTVFADATTELALKSDLMWVRTTSSATAGLAPVDGADASRVRLLLTGRHRHVLATGAELTPNVELGLRYDDGAAETGAGVELGGGLRYADPALGLTVEATARTLLAHEAGGYEEWGMGGSLQLDPGRLGRGLSLRLASGWGLTDSSTETLWQQQTASGLARGPGQTPQGRIKAEWAYGLDVPRTRGLFTPYGSVEMAGGGGRTLALGWRFELGQSLSLSLAGERRETALARPEHGLMLQTALPW